MTKEKRFIDSLIQVVTISGVVKNNLELFRAENELVGGDFLVWGDLHARVIIISYAVIQLD